MHLHTLKCMPVYLFTYRAYGSWMPDRPEGFVQKGQGIQPSNSALGAAYRKAMKYQPVTFDQSLQTRLVTKLLAIAQSEAYRLHGVATEVNHVHIVVSWRDPRLPWKKVLGRIKNLLSLDLSRASGMTGRPWFVNGSSRKRVKDRKYLDYLLRRYLPSHRGVQWYEDRGWVNVG